MLAVFGRYSVLTTFDFAHAGLSPLGRRWVADPPYAAAIHSISPISFALARSGNKPFLANCNRYHKTQKRH